MHEQEGGVMSQQREIVMDPYCREHGWSSYWYAAEGDGANRDVVRRPFGRTSNIAQYVEWDQNEGTVYVIREENYERAGLNA